MFSSDSRYTAIETAEIDVPTGDGRTRTVAYKRRRFLPRPAEAGETLVDHRVADGDRLDLLAAHYLDEPTAFWRICDANLVQRPRELTAETGRAVRVAVPWS